MLTGSVIISIKEVQDVMPAAMLVQLAGKYSSNIFVEKGNRSVNAKSIMGMMTIGLNNGDTVLLSAAGADEGEAFEAVKDFLEGKE
ncbi:MAG: HPr family phosphocarrier protein [Lachnospiraceae bacterium]|nr:HPr family phosphocarrier protein [Lachnospiraceae bacterium]